MLITTLAVHFYTGLTGVLLDLLAIAVIGLNVWSGVHFGVIRRLVAALGAYIATLAAGAAGNQVMRSLHGTDSDVTANAWTFIGLFVLGIVLFEVLGALWDERLHKLADLVLDRTLGTVLGLFLAIFELGIAAIVAAGVAGSVPAFGRTVPTNPGSAASSMDNSIVFGVVRVLEPGIKVVARPVLPSSGDMTVHLAGSSSGVQ